MPDQCTQYSGVNKDISRTKTCSTSAVMVHTGVLEVHILAVESILQAVSHYLELHDLLAYCYVWLGDVDIHFGIVDLTC